MTIYTKIIIAFWIIFLFYWLVSSLSAKRNTRESMRSLLVMRFITVIVFVVIFVGGAKIFDLHAADIAIKNPIINIIGVILTGLGIALAIWARIHIGKNWGMPMSQKENPELVTSGPYKYIRHPIYTGAILGIFGSAFVAGYVWLIVFVFYFIYFTFSAKTEEKNLIALFPEQYPEYKKRTKMLIPFIF